MNIIEKPTRCFAGQEAGTSGLRKKSAISSTGTGSGLETLIEAAEAIAGIERNTGREKPDVIT